VSRHRIRNFVAPTGFKKDTSVLKTKTNLSVAVRTKVFERLNARPGFSRGIDHWLWFVEAHLHARR
jgi:hypothetical protein